MLLVILQGYWLESSNQYDYGLYTEHNIDNSDLFLADFYLFFFMDYFRLDLDQILHSAPQDPQPNHHLHSDQKHPLSSQLGP